MKPTSQRGFEPRMLFFESRLNGIGSHSWRMTYEISDEEVGSGQKQRNVPVWSIVGQYSA